MDSQIERIELKVSAYINAFMQLPPRPLEKNINKIVRFIKN